MIEVEESFLIGGAIGALLLVALTIAFLVLFFMEKKKAKRLNRSLSDLGNRFNVYQHKMEPLKKYQNIKDANDIADKVLKDSESLKARSESDYNKKISEAINIGRRQAEEVILAAEQQRANVDYECAKITSEAKNTAELIIKSSKEKAQALTKNAEEKISAAHDIANKLENDAKKQAEEIAGQAWEAKENADQYEATVKAMKNIIKGYGDEYLIPNRSILDELAEEYDHKKAGQDLKNIRLVIKQIMSRGEAADCDYVEASRRSSAIDFVLDAFNGKVDTIMSKVKHDNYGQLLQQLKDAYRLVNHNGAAFRNARITDKYFDVMLEQLKLAVTTQELKRADMEEQRAIKEQMREEERARRDYEKARKEVEKEEKMLQKAMKEAEAKLADSAAENKAEWQAKLDELHTKLEEAESRGQRALSMAQQTKQGHVYVISNVGSFGEDVFKIGLTRRLEPMDRVKELGDASVPFGFDVHAMIFSENAPELESDLHKVFSDHQVNKVNARKEFFRIPIHKIKSHVDESEMEAQWTLKAEALEYRESLQIEKKNGLSIEPVL